MATTPSQFKGLPIPRPLSEERARKLVAEQRRQMAADNAQRREEEQNPTFRNTLKRKGALGTLRWALSQ